MPRPTNALEWLNALWPKLRDQQKHAQKYNEYYEGTKVLEIVKRDFGDVFDGLLEPTKTNLSELAVESLNERLMIEGFKSATEPDVDSAESLESAAMEVWLRSEMDEMAPVVNVESSVKGLAFLLVWPDPDNAEQVLISAEDAEQVVMAREQSPPYRPLAVVKTWRDDWGDGEFAEVYVRRDGVYRFHKPGNSIALRETGLVLPRGATIRSQEWRGVAFDGGATTMALPGQWNGELPWVEITSRLRLRQNPRSDLVSIAPLQQAYDKLLADLMVSASFGAVPIRYFTGVKIRTDADGRPVDQSGNRMHPFNVRADRVWGSPDAQSKFGTLETATLEGFIRGLEAVHRDFRSVSRVPFHYWDMGGTSGVAGETLKALEGPLARRVEWVERRRGPRFAKATHLAMQYERGGQVPPLRTVWADTETKAESQQADAAQKMLSSGVPMDVVLEQILGWPRDVIQTVLRRREEEQLNADALLAAVQADVLQGQPATSVPAEPVEPADPVLNGAG